MNTLVIVLGVMLVVIIMMSLFSRLFSSETTLAENLHLAGAIPDLANDKLTSSANRTYGVLIYVNTWDNNNKNKMIFGRENDVLLYLDKSSAVLKCKIKPTADEVTNANSSADVIPDVVDITNNFPIQKWVYVTIVLDSTGITDFYLDGKLVKSVQNENISVTVSSSPLKFGSGHDTYISKIDRIGKVLGPSDVWSKYMKNNSGSSLKNSIGNYNVNLSILKDNVIASTFSF